MPPPRVMVGGGYFRVIFLLSAAARAFDDGFGWSQKSVILSLEAWRFSFSLRVGAEVDT